MLGRSLSRIAALIVWLGFGTGCSSERFDSDGSDSGGSGGSGGAGSLGHAVHWRQGACAVLDGVSEQTAFSNASFTVEMLIRISGSTEYQGLVYHGGHSTAVPSGWTVELARNTDHYLLSLCGGDTAQGAPTLCPTGGAIHPDIPHHIAVVRDRAQLESRFYVAKLAFAHAPFSAPFAADWPTVDQLTVGGYGQFCEFPADVIMDELRIWSTMRDAEIETFDDTTVECSTPGLEAYYRFDEEPGSLEFADCSGKSGKLNALSGGFEIIDSPFDD
jgi:hypothetical protein